MARHGQPRVRGPYDLGDRWRAGSRWRVDVLAAGESSAVRSYFASQELAEQFIELARAEFGIAKERTIEDAVTAYEQHMKDKGNKPKSYRETVRRLKLFFPDHAKAAMQSLTPTRTPAYYESLRQRRIGCTEGNPEGRPISVDTHRNMLAEAKTFLGWCVDKKWLAVNPLDEVTGMGRRRKGKPQLRIDESRRWLDKALELADSYQGRGADDGPLAAMLTFVLGMRCSEVVERVVRDVDDGGRLLWIPDSKTPAGRRTLEVPPVLQPYLRALSQNRAPTERLFSSSSREWPTKWVKRICIAAGVPVVSGHGLRGTHATLAMDRGSTGQVVAAQLGHESATTTCENYASRSAQATGQQRRFMKVLRGGQT